MSGYFEVEKNRFSKYYFNLFAGNGQVIYRSREYESKASALKGIESLKKNVENAKVLDLT